MRRQFGVDLQDLATWLCCRRRPAPGVFSGQAVGVIRSCAAASVARASARSGHEDDVGGRPRREEASWLPDADAITRVPSRVMACTLPRRSRAARRSPSIFLRWVAKSSAMCSRRVPGRRRR